MIFKTKFIYKNISKLLKNNHSCIKFILIFLITVILGFILFIFIKNTYSNKTKEGLTRAVMNVINSEVENERIFNIINNKIPGNLQMQLAKDHGQNGFDRTEQRLLTELYSSIGMVSRIPTYNNANDSRYKNELLVIETALHEDRDAYKRKYKDALVEYDKLSKRKVNIKQLKDSCNTLYKKIGNLLPDITLLYSSNNANNLYLYKDVSNVLNSMQELNNNLNAVVDFSNNTLNPEDPNSQDIINYVAKLRDNLKDTDDNIEKYIKYPIDFYNTSLTSYIKKFKDIKNMHIFNIKRVLKNINLDDVNKYNKQVIIYGITANVDQNFDNNYLQPTLRNGKYKKHNILG